MTNWYIKWIAIEHYGLMVLVVDMSIKYRYIEIIIFNVAIGGDWK